MKLAIHPLNEALIPPYPAKRFEELVEDIKVNGLLYPILLYEGKIINGRHRYKACLMADVKPKTIVFKGDPIKLIVSSIIHRDLTTGQRAAVADKIAALLQGQHMSVLSTDKTHRVVRETKTMEEAAKEIGVSVVAVSRFREIKKASPELAEKVSKGTISLNSATTKVRNTETHKPGEEMLIVAHIGTAKSSLTKAKEKITSGAPIPNLAPLIKQHALECINLAREIDKLIEGKPLPLRSVT
jgi:ParB-like chromosome segregation protein Spo0J